MKASVRFLYWLPRIICILAILFVSMFALDSFAPELTLWQQIGGFLIHLIPSFVLITILIIAWKREMIGGYIFMLLGIVLSPLLFMWNYKMNHSIGMSLGIIAAITMPFIIIGILFIASHRVRRRNVQP
jgi:cytochrome b561